MACRFSHLLLTNAPAVVGVVNMPATCTGLVMIGAIVHVSGCCVAVLLTTISADYALALAGAECWGGAGR